MRSDLEAFIRRWPQHEDSIRAVASIARGSGPVVKCGYCGASLANQGLRAVTHYVDCVLGEARV